MTTVTTLRSASKTVTIGFASGVLLTLPAVMAAVASGGAGHGDYVGARALFPVPMLFALLEGGRVRAFPIVVGLLQFPVYGALLGWSIARKNYIPAVIVALAHIIAALLSFVGTLRNFS